MQFLRAFYELEWRYSKAKPLLMTYSTLVFAVADGVAEITLNRPDKLNSFNPDMLRELHAVFQIIETDAAIRAVLITGTGRGFCAGQDLNVRQGQPGEKGELVRKSLNDNFNPLIRRIHNLKKPIVAAVNGIAAGAGANLALSCDIVIAAESASFLQAFVNIGLVPDCGGTFYLPRLVGMARAKAAALLGEKIPAKQAADWGMIWKVVPDQQLMSDARSLAKRLAAGPSVALGLIKQALDVSVNHDLDRHLDWERDAQGLAAMSEDFAEGVNAFLEKRPAKFTGK
jgi:2-(1,2-epoxy-1,2-dihydrophenyl)acetyl-CoA isomerase